MNFENRICPNRFNQVKSMSIERSIEREQLQYDVEQFLKAGGKIKVYPSYLTNFKSDIEKTKTYKKRVRPLLNLYLWDGESDEKLLNTESMAIALGASESWLVTEYTKKHLIPRPLKLKDLDGEIKTTKQNHNANYWKLGDLIKHNKELEK